MRIEKPVAENPIVLDMHAGGLGDALIYSTLPERYARAGYDVYLCNEPPLRNPEVRSLVWERNPFLRGFTDAKPNVGAEVLLRGAQQSFFGGPKRYRSIVEAFEAAHGFVPQNVYPKIYYTPKFRRDARDTVFADPRSISQPIEPKLFDAFAKEICRWQQFDFDKVVQLESRYAGHHGTGALRGNPVYRVGDIYEYVDLIYSSKAFLVAESGGQTLASAIRGHSAFPRMFSLMTTRSYNDKLFVFDNITYHITGAASPDYAGYPPGFK